jgi:hypothetical protein
MGFVQSTYTGVGPTTNNQSGGNAQTAIQQNIARINQLLSDVIGYKYQRYELNQQAANTCAMAIRGLINNGALANRVYSNFGNNLADDNQLRSFADYLVTEWIQQAVASGINVVGMPQQVNQPVNMYGQPMQQQMYGQPMQQQMYGQPMQQQMYGQPMQQQQMYGQPMQQQMYNRPMQGQPMQQQQMYNRSMYGQPMQQQPVYGQPMQQQPVYGQPMQQQPVYGQPVYGQPMQQQMYGQPMQQPMYGGQQNKSVSSRIYGNRASADKSAMYNSAPTQTTGSKVYTQQPQTSTYQAPQQAPQVQPKQQQSVFQQCVTTPTPDNPRGFNPYGNRTVEDVQKSIKEMVSQIDPVTLPPKVVDLTEEEAAKIYPEDEYGFREKYVKFVKLMKLEYAKHVYGEPGQKKVVKASVDAQVIELKEESAPSNVAAIKRVLSANQEHDPSKPFIYKIGYNKEIVIDVPYSLAHTNHDNVQRVWNNFTDPEDESSIYKVLEIKPFEVAKALIMKFKTTNPQYMNAIEPIIVDLYNNVIDTASIVKTTSGKRIAMESANNIDDIYNACCLTDNSTYEIFKNIPEYTTALMNALNSSLFAVYNPLVHNNYLNVNDAKDRATALANPEIGVMVSYVTDRHLNGVKVDGKEVDSKKLKNLVDTELWKHFVLTIQKCTVYTNMDIPFVKEPAKTSFAPAMLDTKNGDTNIFLIQAMSGVASGYIPTNICVPEVVLANDRTTEKCPFVIVSTMDEYALVRRVITA